MDRRIFVLALLIGGAAVAAPAHAQILADSIADFSGVQGSNGWFYGYTTPGAGEAGFQLMNQFDGTQWHVDSDHYWTMIGRFGTHPNGTTTSGFALPEEQWSVRRWVSTYDGPVDIGADLFKLNVNPLGNGVEGHIFVDGTEVWQHSIVGTDSIGMQPHVLADLSVGSIVDFTLEPLDGNDWADGTHFSGVITAVPTPGSLALGAIGFLAAGSRRRRAS